MKNITFILKAFFLALEFVICIPIIIGGFLWFSIHHYWGVGMDMNKEFHVDYLLRQ